MAIRINPGQVKAVAAKFRSASAELQAEARQVQSSAENVSSHWEGKSKGMFLEDFRVWQNKVRELENTLQNIARQLDITAERFAAADRQAQGGRGGGGGDSW